MRRLLFNDQHHRNTVARLFAQRCCNKIMTRDVKQSWLSKGSMMNQRGAKRAWLEDGVKTGRHCTFCDARSDNFSV
jgi:hypothetical protein